MLIYRKVNGKIVIICLGTWQFDIYIYTQCIYIYRGKDWKMMINDLVVPIFRQPRFKLCLLSHGTSKKISLKIRHCCNEETNAFAADLHPLLISSTWKSWPRHIERMMKHALQDKLKARPWSQPVCLDWTQGDYSLVIKRGSGKASINEGFNGVMGASSINGEVWIAMFDYRRVIQVIWHRRTSRCIQ